MAKRFRIRRREWDIPVVVTADLFFIDGDGDLRLNRGQETVAFYPALSWTGIENVEHAEPETQPIPVPSPPSF